MKRVGANLALGLGLLVGAVLPQRAGAQVPDTTRRARRDTIAIPARPPSDSLLRDSLARRDTTTPPRDTIKAPLARAEMPVTIGVGESLTWTGDSLFATGAITLQDLLDRIPGVTGLRAGWLAAPMIASYMGDVGRVRLFLDGLELDDLEPGTRTGREFDLSQIQLWTIEELRIERGASELRIYMRSWRVDRTTPYTRTDVSTGDQQTNMYRGFFGRRFGHGEALQLAAQQYGTTPSRNAASSDQLGVLARVGWAKGRLSLDAFGLRTSRHRGILFTQDPFITDSIAEVESARIDGYVRVAWGDPEGGPWVQALAGINHYKFTGRPGPDDGDENTPVPSADSITTRGQHLLSAGFSRFGLRVSGTGRVRVFEDRTVFTPSARAGFESRYLAVDAFAEGRDADSISRAEAGVRLSPLPFLSVAGTASVLKDERTGMPETTTSLRAEAGIRLFGLWLIGGLLRRDSTVLPGAFIFENDAESRVEPVATAKYVALRGRLYKDLRANVYALRWDDSTGFYRPQFQTRSELYLQTNWLSRFPRGNFGFLLSGVHEYRSNTRFPTQEGDVIVAGSRTISTLLEIRLYSAVAFWQFRNVLGDPYRLVPGYLMPRQTQFYGVRWEFWN